MCRIRSEYNNLRGLYQQVDELPFAVTSDYAELVKLVAGQTTKPRHAVEPEESTATEKLVHDLHEYIHYTGVVCEPGSRAD